MINTSSQVILSTNIAESSVTVPDVKYGGVLLPYAYCPFVCSVLGIMVLLLCHCSN